MQKMQNERQSTIHVVRFNEGEEEKCYYGILVSLNNK